MARTVSTAAVSPAVQSTHGARSRSLWLAAARVLWVTIAVIDISLFITSVPAHWARLSDPTGRTAAALLEAGMATNFYAAYTVTLEIIFALVFTVVAVVIFAQKLNDLPAMFFSLLLVTFGTASYPVMPTLGALMQAQPAMMPVVRFMSFLTWVIVFVFFCVFPDGRFVPRWSPAFALFATLISIPWNLWPDSPWSPATWPPELFIALELYIWGTCLYMQAYRYRHLSDRVQRQQTRWVVLGVSITVAGVLGFYLPRVLDPAFSQPNDRISLAYSLLSSTVIVICALFTPVTMAFSILRYRLWAIDPIINRALVYVPLTGILGGLYTTSIVIFQRFFVAVTGDKSDAAVVISTLILASLFTPVRNALQAAVDKRFKDTRHPTARLDELRKQVHSVTEVFDLPSLAQKLLDEAVEAFDAQGGAVYLASHNQHGRYGPYGDLKLVHGSDKWKGDVRISVPLMRNGTRYGLLVLGPRRNRQDYTEEDRKKLQEAVDMLCEALGLAEAAEAAAHQARDNASPADLHAPKA